MRKLRINRASENFTSNFSKFFSFVIEGNDLCGADKGKVKGVEEEHNILSLVLLETDLNKF